LQLILPITKQKKLSTTIPNAEHRALSFQLKGELSEAKSLMPFKIKQMSKPVFAGSGLSTTNVFPQKNTTHQK
jgi:hypothetical protein